MTRGRRIVPVLAAFALLTAALEVRADEAADVEKGTTSYDAGRYEEGAERFGQMLDPTKPQALKETSKVERARAYYAACLIALGRIEEAKQQIERIYRQNPVFVPDPVVFPGAVVDLFAESRQRLKEEIIREDRRRAADEENRRREQARAREAHEQYLATLRELASHETTVVRHQRWLAAVPFGVGQFQNGQDGLGYTFLVSELVTAGISLASAGVVLALTADGTAHLKTSGSEVAWGDLNQRLATARTVNLYSTLAFVALALGGVVHAQLTFVPEVREGRTRPIPPPPTVAPNVSMVPSGLSVGLAGHF